MAIAGIGGAGGMWSGGVAPIAGIDGIEGAGKDSGFGGVDLGVPVEGCGAAVGFTAEMICVYALGPDGGGGSVGIGSMPGREKARVALSDGRELGRTLGADAGNFGIAGLGGGGAGKAGDAGAT